jgi:hypothetical protein
MMVTLDILRGVGANWNAPVARLWQAGGLVPRWSSDSCAPASALESTCDGRYLGFRGNLNWTMFCA